MIGRRGASILVVVAAMASWPAALRAHGPQAENFRISVVISYVRDLGDSADSVTAADFYAKVKILDTTTKTATIDDERTIRPNWLVTGDAPATATSIPMRIEIWDEDGFLNGDDDAFDLDVGNDRPFNFTLNLADCTMTGDSGFAGACGGELTTRGDAGTDRAELRFRVSLERPTEPVVADRLRIRCLHSPLWPATGATVTVTAKSVDAALANQPVDALEIWIGTTLATTCAANSDCSTTATATGGTFFYQCVARAVDRQASTGWRQVAVNNGTVGTGPVSVLFTKASDQATDFVFVPDKDDYLNAADPTFQQDIFNAIWNAYYAADTYLFHQNRINFWLANETGDYKALCKHTLPANWNSAYSFADAGGIIHRDAQRDCAVFSKRIFSSMSAAFGIYLHETGHQPFGLADEYCCDGGYFRPRPNPNLYANADQCRADLGDLAWWDVFLADTTARVCRSFRDEDDETWWRSDPDMVTAGACCDLMVDNSVFRGADARRIDWFFRQLVP